MRTRPDSATATSDRAPLWRSIRGVTSRDDLLCVLVIGGLDPSGGAGITADARTLLLHGCEALPVLAAVAVQNRFGMQRVEPVASELVRRQLVAAIEDGGVRAAKTGLLGSAARVREVAAWLRELAPDLPLVVDPVLSATAGGYEAGRDVARAYRETLLARATVFTPNAPELEAVAEGGNVGSLLTSGCKAVLHKGGHAEGSVVVDRLVTATAASNFEHERLPVGAVHGTGCALASAVAAGLAHGLSIAASTQKAVVWLERCLRAMGRASGTLPRPLVLVPPPAHD